MGTGYVFPLSRLRTVQMLVRTTLSQECTVHYTIRITLSQDAYSMIQYGTVRLKPFHLYEHRLMFSPCQDAYSTNTSTHYNVMRTYSILYCTNFAAFLALGLGVLGPNSGHCALQMLFTRLILLLFLEKIIGEFVSMS